MYLLTKNNTKTKKNEKEGFITYILYLNPHKKNSKGVNLCKGASKGCVEACLVGAGQGGMNPKVKTARQKRTEFFVNNRDAFMMQLAGEIFQAIGKHGKDNISIRLNGTSDIPFEDIPLMGYNNIFELFSEIQFYDYTKRFNRLKKDLPANYYLVFSRNEVNGDRCIEALKLGFNVAIVFDRIPSDYYGYEVIDGDQHDVRWNEQGGKIIGLKYKPLTGKGARPVNMRAKKSGFIVKADEVETKERIE